MDFYCKQTSLRDIKKEKTTNDLAEAAFELAIERGLDGFVVDDIVQRAGYSRRTFANYFSCKEEAVVTVALNQKGASKVADFILEINENTPPYVGGYFIGSETYIPAKDYFTKPGIKVNWKYAFERQWLFYKIWGRLLYNPDTPDEIFASEFKRRYGKEGNNLLEAFSLAGTVPLRLASSFDFTWDFSLYSEGFMALDNTVKRVEYISIERRINQPPIDPDYVSVADYVKTISAGGSFEKNKITPLILADMVERDCKQALALVKDIKVSGNNALMFEVADVKAWSNMGLHFAEKLRGAVALQTYRTKGGEENKQVAIKYLENSLKFWDVVISITRPIYNDMPLTHYSEQNGVRSKENQRLLFHWEKLRPDVAKDVEIAKKSVFNAAAAK